MENSKIKNYKTTSEVVTRAEGVLQATIASWCHPERSEGSAARFTTIASLKGVLRFAQDDKLDEPSFLNFEF